MWGIIPYSCRKSIFLKWVGYYRDVRTPFPPNGRWRDCSRKDKECRRVSRDKDGKHASLKAALSLHSITSPFARFSSISKDYSLYLIQRTSYATLGILYVVNVGITTLLLNVFNTCHVT